ncbi:MAG: glycoside hydrolase family 32 protein [Gorillibacterium sp.]|nr:glycoside hydrolase family 32 protein [Gorillibacterium sp.]
MKHKDALLRAQASVDRAASAVMENNRYRLDYHVMSPAFWINDPNGFVYYKGQYHLFYQHHPYSVEWGPMHWGHVVSDDLVNWRHLPIALAPSEPYDCGGIYSGSAVAEGDTLYLFYTGITDQGGQVQCVARSQDGIRFEKYADNPIVQPPNEETHDFRDPKVWRKDQTWYMVIGSKADGKGNVQLYKADEPLSWTYVGKMAESDGALGEMWECPDLAHVGDQDLLFLSPMNIRGINNLNIIIQGKMDYTAGSFTLGPWRDMDYGHDFYASQSMENDQGRRVMIAWMDMWCAPMPSQKEGWAGAMTLPRDVLISENGSVLTPPVPELEKLRGEHIAEQQLVISPDQPNGLNGLQGDALEIKIIYDLKKSSATQFGIAVRCSVDHSQATLVSFDVPSSTILVDRSRSGEPVGEDRPCKVDIQEGKLILHLFVDRSSLEVFVNAGEQVITNRIYPDPASLYVELFSSEGTAYIEQIDAWQLNAIW